VFSLFATVLVVHLADLTVFQIHIFTVIYLFIRYSLICVVDEYSYHPNAAKYEMNIVFRLFFQYSKYETL